MVDLGDIAKAINAEATILEIGVSTDEFLVMYDITETGAHPINTITTRAGRADFYSSPIREITFLCLATKDTHDRLKTLNTLDARFKLTTENFVMTGKALSGAAEDIIVQFAATVPTLDRLAAASGWLFLRVTLRIDNASYVP